MSPRSRSVYRLDRVGAWADAVLVSTSKGSVVKVYGATEIARALGVEPALVSKWRERNKLPAPDAELSFGPVWLAQTIEPVLAAGGPPRRTPGGPLSRYVVKARMTADPCPAVGERQRNRFAVAIEQTRNRSLGLASVDWEDDRKAIVRLYSEAPDPETAAVSIESLIMRAAQNTGEINVEGVEIIEVAVNAD